MHDTPKKSCLDDTGTAFFKILNQKISLSLLRYASLNIEVTVKKRINNNTLPPAFVLPYAPLTQPA